MTRSMRAVRTEWADAGAIFMDPEDFRDLVAAIVGTETTFTYIESAADAVHKLFVGCGRTFLDLVKRCDARKVVRGLPRELRRDALGCIENLKALEPAWRNFIDSDGHLQVWVDS